MPYVYSTGTCGVDYTDYKSVTGDIKRPIRKVSIAGGSNVAGKNLITPYGVATQVSEEDLAFLQAHPLFKKHLERGFVSVSKTKKDPEKVIAATNMPVRDGSAPETPETIAARGAKLLEEKKTTK